MSTNSPRSLVILPTTCVAAELLPVSRVVMGDGEAGADACLLGLMFDGGVFDPRLTVLQVLVSRVLVMLASCLLSRVFPGRAPAERAPAGSVARGDGMVKHDLGDI